MERLFYIIALFSLFILYFFSVTDIYSKNIFSENSYDSFASERDRSRLFVIDIDKDLPDSLNFYEYMLSNNNPFADNDLVPYLYASLPKPSFSVSIFAVSNSISFSREEVVYTLSNYPKTDDYIVDLSETNTASSIISSYIRSFGVLSSNDVRFNDLVRELSSYRSGIVFGDIFLSINPFKLNILFLY